MNPKRNQKELHNCAKLSQDSGRHKTNTDQKHLPDIKLEFKCDKLKNTHGQATGTQTQSKISQQNTSKTEHKIIKIATKMPNSKGIE